VLGLPVLEWKRDFAAKEKEEALAREARRPLRRVRALAYVLLIGMIVGLIGWINQSYVKEQWHWWTTVRPLISAYALTRAQERALKPEDTFRECASGQGTDYCPEMVVVPSGSFTMGSPPTEKGRDANEGPQHAVTIVKPYAVSKFEVTFAEWDTCITYGDCPNGISDSYFGRGQQPVINVTWDDARRYAAWLSKATGKHYRLLSEAEFEYATRSGTQTLYPWGDDVGANNANCNGCGSQWDASQTAPVGSFAPNRFGLYDMVGNVWQWVEDCYHPDYQAAPADGSAWISGDCTRRVGRSAGWDNGPEYVRSAHRGWDAHAIQFSDLGFRIARTLEP
jgi:formylglycine-generating enzyme required for sulfatase activity